jgi:hypothetical protein
MSILCRYEPTFFQFEADFVYSLRCIPMQVRFKLDACGVKLKLSHWSQFNSLDRQMLVDAPLMSMEDVQAFGERVQQLVIHYTGTPAGILPIEFSPLWLNADAIPADVQEQARSLNATITSEQWAQMTSLQRYALIKLSRPSHENKNFLPALKEFQVV